MFIIHQIKWIDSRKIKNLSIKMKNKIELNKRVSSVEQRKTGN